MRQEEYQTIWQHKFAEVAWSCGIDPDELAEPLDQLAKTERNLLSAGRWFEDDIILLCLRWYFRFKLSYRDLVSVDSSKCPARNLITPHGDRKHLGKNVETAERLVNSLPLMGIVNREMSRVSWHLGCSHSLPLMGIVNTD